MRILGYIRVSTDTQSIGIEVQKRSIEEYAKKVCIPIHELYIDEAVSGKSEKRDGLLRLMCELKRDDILVIHKRDRLSRDTLFIQVIEREIRRIKAKLISTQGEGTESDDYGSIGMRKIIDVFSEMERSIISSRIKAALQSKINKNEFVGMAPYGKRISSDGIHLEDNDKELEILDAIIAMREKGLSVTKIIKRLSLLNMLSRNNKVWCSSTINQLIYRHIKNSRKTYKKKLSNDIRIQLAQ